MMYLTLTILLIIIAGLIYSYLPDKRAKKFMKFMTMFAPKIPFTSMIEVYKRQIKDNK